MGVSVTADRQASSMGAAAGGLGMKWAGPPCTALTISTTPSDPMRRSQVPNSPSPPPSSPMPTKYRVRPTRVGVKTSQRWSPVASTKARFNSAAPPGDREQGNFFWRELRRVGDWVGGVRDWSNLLVHGGKEVGTTPQCPDVPCPPSAGGACPRPGPRPTAGYKIWPRRPGNRRAGRPGGECGGAVRVSCTLCMPAQPHARPSPAPDAFPPSPTPPSPTLRRTRKATWPAWATAPRTGVAGAGGGLRAPGAWREVGSWHVGGWGGVGGEIRAGPGWGGCGSGPGRPRTAPCTRRAGGAPAALPHTPPLPSHQHTEGET